MGRQIRSESHTIETDTNPTGQGARVGESRVNFLANFLARRPSDSVYDVFRRTKEAGAQMSNSNDVASVELLWERVLSLLVVGASVLGGSAVLLIQAVPPILHGFP